jgi:hypothetical protein
LRTPILLTATFLICGSAQACAEQERDTLATRVGLLTANFGKLRSTSIPCRHPDMEVLRLEMITTILRHGEIERDDLNEAINTAWQGVRPERACHPSLVKIYLDRHLTGLHLLDELLWARAFHRSLPAPATPAESTID